MHDAALPEEWEILRRWLADDLDRRGRPYGFMRRPRGLQDAERRLRLILMHMAGGLSLQQTAVVARELGLARIGSVALFKRWRKAERWVADLTRHLLADHQRLFGLQRRLPVPYQVRIIDATDIGEPGEPGTSLRVHDSLRLPELSCDRYELTYDGGGEKLGRLAFHPGELVLADRAIVIGPGSRRCWLPEPTCYCVGTRLLFRWKVRTGKAGTCSPGCGGWGRAKSESGR